MRVWHSLPLITLMSACGIQDNKIPIYSDYCENSHRSFSNREKIQAAIKYILIHKNTPIYKADVHFSHLTQYYSANKKRKFHELSAIYYREFPECCRIIKPPSYVKWYHAMSRVGMSNQEIMGTPGDWVADVLIIDLARTKESQRLQQSQFRIGGCNQISLINRG